MYAMSIFYQTTNSQPSTAARDGSREPSETCNPMVRPSIGGIIEVSWVRNDTLRFDVDCIRRERVRSGDEYDENYVAGRYLRHVPHQLIHN